LATELTDKQAEQLRKPAGWCRGFIGEKQPVFYPEQEWDINLPSNVLIYCKRKTRRGGWSHGLVHRAVSLAHLVPDISIYFVSINLNDAFKKIEECKKLYYEIHPDARLPLDRENMQQLRFRHGRASYSEIEAVFKPRGMPGRNIQVVIDEADHILDLQATLQAAVPNTIQGNSQLIVGGSVLRDHGPFWDLFNLDIGEIFKGSLDDEAIGLLRSCVVRKELFWWQVPWLLNPEARKNPSRVASEAPVMETKDRVVKFGSDRLKVNFAINNEDFQQEYELKAVKEGTSVIPWDFILRASNDPEMEFIPTLDQLAAWAFDTGMALLAGYDVGHRSNSSELTIFGYNEREDFAVEKYAETFVRKALPDQTEYLRKVLKRLPQLVLAIDAGGLGAEMSETLFREFPRRVIPVEFDYYAKLGIFDAFAKRVIDGRVRFIADAERRRQMHSIKKKISEAGRVIYYVPRKEKHHADKAVSQALGIHAIDSIAIGAPFVVYTGGSTLDYDRNELDELYGTHEDFLRDIVNA